MADRMRQAADRAAWPFVQNLVVFVIVTQLIVR